MAGYQGTGTRNDYLEALSAMIEAERREHYTSLTGKVVSYDAKRQKATIQPLLSQTFEGKTLQAPPLQDVPVQHVRAGGLIIHKPLKPGDEVRLDFAGRSMDATWDDGSDTDRAPGRLGSLSDAMATPSASSKTKELPNLPADRMHMGTEDGQSGFQMKDDGSFDILKGGDTLMTLFVDFLKAYKSHTGMSAADMAKAQELIDRAEAMKAT